ncbi:hypothetical protein [Streptomyces sp. NPDC051776]
MDEITRRHTLRIARHGAYGPRDAKRRAATDTAAPADGEGGAR